MKKLMFVGGIILLLFAFMVPVLAQEPSGEAGRVVIGSDLILEEGDFIEDNVVVFGGNFTMEEGSEVKGDVVVFGGEVIINGRVKGNVADMGGDIRIEEDAVIDGDVASVAGTISIDEDAEISGTVTDGFNLDSPEDVRDVPDVEAVEEPGNFRHREFDKDASFSFRIGRFLEDGIQDIFAAVIIAGLSVLIIIFFPAHVKTIQETLVTATPVSFILGIITFFATVAIIILLILFSFLIIPICGIVVVFLAWAVALLTGWAVIGKIIGTKIFTHFNNPDATEVSSTLLGVALLVLVARMPFLDHIPFIGWLFSLSSGLVFVLVASTGLGAVVLSRFGTQLYQTNTDTALVEDTAEDTAMTEQPDDITPDDDSSEQGDV